MRAVIAPIDLLGFLSFLSPTSQGLIIHFAKRFSATEQEASCSSHISSSVPTTKPHQDGKRQKEQIQQSPPKLGFYDSYPLLLVNLSPSLSFFINATRSNLLQFVAISTFPSPPTRLGLRNHPPIPPDQKPLPPPSSNLGH